MATTTRKITKHGHIQVWFVPKPAAAFRVREPLAQLRMLPPKRQGRARARYAGQGRAPGRGVCRRPRSRRYSLRAPSLTRIPNPFSPCDHILEHGSFLSAAAQAAADVDVLDWLDQYGTNEGTFEEPAGIMPFLESDQSSFALGEGQSPPDSPSRK